MTDQIERKNVHLQYCPMEDMISDFFTKPLQGSQFRTFRDFILNIDHGDRAVGTQECVETSSVTTGLESRVEPDGPSTCLAPLRSYAEVVAGKPGTSGMRSLVRSQCSKVNFHSNC